jgi:hypothetical protein
MTAGEALGAGLRFQKGVNFTTLNLMCHENVAIEITKLYALTIWQIEKKP